MGYGFHITRSQEWVDDVGIITTEQWLDVARSIEGLQPISEVEIGDTTLELPPERQSHRWIGHPEAAVRRRWAQE